jgi:hypothetical protein
MLHAKRIKKQIVTGCSGRTVVLEVGWLMAGVKNGNHLPGIQNF